MIINVGVGVPKPVKQGRTTLPKSKRVTCGRLSFFFKNKSKTDSAMAVESQFSQTYLGAKVQMSSVEEDSKVN